MVITQACLDEHVLSLVNLYPGSTRYLTPDNTDDGWHYIQLQLPNDVICTQCVLQWKYNAGNTWGSNDDGTHCQGCGPQEQFYGCSDVSIESYSVSNSPSTPTPTLPSTPHASVSLSSSHPQTSSTSPSSILSSSATPTALGSTSTTLPTHGTTHHQTLSTPSHSSSISSNVPTTPTLSTSQGTSTSAGEQPTPSAIVSDPQLTCVARGLWEGDAGMTQWCQDNCSRGHCPVTRCDCGNLPPLRDCGANSVYKVVPGMDIWCQNMCDHGDCQETHCICH